MSIRIESCAKTVEYTGIEWLNIDQYYWVRNHAEDKNVFDTTLNSKASYSSSREYEELFKLMKALHETKCVNDKLIKISEETILPYLHSHGSYQSYFTFAVQQLIELKEKISNKKKEVIATCH